MMGTQAETRCGSRILSKIDKLPFISVSVKTRGRYFILSWCHRITGLALVAFLWIHIVFLKSLPGMDAHIQKAQGLGSSIVSFLEWVLVIPIIFHVFNGGRLILYESFGKRADESMTRWTFALSVVYLAILGSLMLIGGQSVSPFLFWLIMLVTALIAIYGVGAKIWSAGHTFFWKLQRISGAFLIVMVPAYILFIHLESLGIQEGKGFGTGVQQLLMRVTYIGLLLGALYHGGYGIWSVASDYVSSQSLRTGIAVLVAFGTLIFAWVGIRLTLGL